MKLLTFPVKLLIRLLVLPVKVVLATAGLTFRAGFKAGTLPVKGSAVAVRSLGLKAVVLFAAGIALGVVIGRRLGSAGAELADASYPGSFGVVDDGPTPVATLVEETIEVVDTPEGEVVTDTLTVTEVFEEAAEPGDAAGQELDDEREAEIDQALGFTAGELGVDVADDGDR
jgi:hypothetical protein